MIADNVGDNVGDCAGMAADLFETYLVTAVAAMLLGDLIGDVRAASRTRSLYPLAVGGCGILATLAGIAFVRMRPGGTIMGALYRGLAATLVVLVVPLRARSLADARRIGRLRRLAVGLAVVVALVALTNYYTSAISPRCGGSPFRGGRRRRPVVITGLSSGSPPSGFRARDRRRDARGVLRDGMVRRGVDPRSGCTASALPPRACSR